MDIHIQILLGASTRGDLYQNIFIRFVGGVVSPKSTKQTKTISSILEVEFETCFEAITQAICR